MDRPPLNERDRRALAAVAAQFFVNGAMTASFLARAPQIRDRIDVTVDQYGLLLAGAGACALVGSVLAGAIVHRAGTRRVLIVGAVILVGCLVAIGLAPSWPAFLVPLVVYGFVDALVDISMNLQGSWLSARRHRPVMNRLHGLWSVGTLVGGLGATAASAVGMSLAVHLTIAASVTGAILLAVTANLLRVDEDGHDDTRDAPPAAVRATPGLLLTLLVVGGALAVVQETMGDWAAFRLADDFDSTAAMASAAFVAFTVGMSSLRVGGDFLQHRWGRMVVHRWSVATVVVGLVLATLVPNRWIAIAGFVLVGAGVATFLPKLYDDAARAPGRRGAGLGAMTAGMRFAFLATPVLVGQLAGSSLSVGSVLAIVALPSAVGFALVTEWNDRVLRPAGAGANA